ncbi:MAG: F0F1 ATP synthase subunit B [Clostridia bacterium]|nr:F0F1 ATP synthase subunit B [Clostridia bacterium]
MEWFLGEFESFVGVNFWTMLFAWANLLLLYIVLKKFLFKPITNMIESRQKEIDDMYSDAETAKSDAEGMKAEYEGRMERVAEESEELLRSAVRRAQLREEEILREAQAQAQRTLDRATEQVELEKKRAINEVKDEVASMAIEIASAVIERDISENEHKELIDGFIDGIGDGND